MGKVRKRKVHKHKNNTPLEVADEEEEVIQDSKENLIQTMIDQIQSVNVEEKYCGLQTFALHIENPDTLQQIVSQDLVKIVAPLLLDAAASIRNTAAGSLRNLSTMQPNICDMLMENDIMTPLICYFHQYTENWVPDISCKTNTEDIDTFIQSVNLLLNLCECSDLAIKYLGESRILDIFPRYLDLSTFGSDVVVAVMQCLFVVIEDNPIAIDKVKCLCENELKILLMLEDNDQLLIRTLAAGIIMNLCGGNLSVLSIDLVNKIISIWAATLAVDHRIFCHKLSSNIPLSQDNEKLTLIKGKEEQILETQIKSVLNILDAQQTAIEIIANVCSTEESEDGIDDIESSDSEEMADGELISNGSGTLLPEDKLSPHIMEALVSLRIFDKIWARTQLPAENVMLLLKEYEGSQLIYKKLLTLQTKALLCINNLLSTYPLENLGGIDGVYKIWVDAGKLVFTQNYDNLNLLESASAVMRAALDKIKLCQNGTTTDCQLFQECSMDDLELMLKGIRDCQVPEIRSNLIRTIGILGMLLVNNLNDTTSHVICVICEFLVEQGHKESEVWVLAEVVDTLVDMFSEDETDALAAKLKLDEKLSGLAPLLRSKARQQNKLPKEYKVLVNTANSNLPRFIKYIRERVRRF